MFPPRTDPSYALALGDVDGDGDLDALVGNSGAQSRLFANDGAGVFSDVTAASLPTLVLDMRAVALGDVDGDGDLDAFSVAVNGPLPVRLLLNGGAGAFTIAPAGSFPPVPPGTAIALGDVDGDGDLEALVAVYAAGVQLLLNAGSGTFINGTPPPAPNGVQAIALGDVDADGDLDAFLGAPGSALLLNGGAGLFVNASAANLPVPSPSGASVALGDVDGDGDVDAFLGLPAYVGPSQVLLLNLGGGVYADATAANLPIQVELTSSVALGDLDGDGDLDAVVGNRAGAPNSGQDRLYQNGGAGVFTDVTGSSFPLALDTTRAVALGDVDGDGDLDVVAANDGGPSRVYLNDGQGVLTAGQVSNVPPAVDTTAAVALGDVDGDGDLDAWAGNAAPVPGDQDRLYLNNGAGLFSDATGTNLPPVLDNTSSVALGDLDGDGDLDSFVGNTATYGPSVGDRLYLNGGAGIFADVTASNLPLVLDVTRAVVLGDLDADGDLDAFMANGWPGNPVAQSRLLLNSGTGSFANVTATNLPALNLDTRAVALGDVDADGDLDVFLGNSGSAGQPERLWLNGGNGVFTDAPATNLPAFADATRAVALGDVDGDGDLDALVGNWGWTTAGESRLYLNGGGGVFTIAVGSLPTAPAFTRTLAFGDLDEDGDLDVFFGSNNQVYASSPNRLFQNSGTGVFTDVTAAELPAAVADTRAVAVGDVDGDGDLDILAGTTGPEVLYTNLTRQLGWRGIPRAGKSLTLDLRGPANGGWLLAAAAGSASIPVSSLGTVLLHPPTTFVVAGGALDAQGRASLSFPVPANPTLVGGSLYWQAIVGPPFRFTNLEITTVTGL